jgi:hypothetical protein
MAPKDYTGARAGGKIGATGSTSSGPYTLYVRQGPFYYTVFEET